MKNKKIIHIIRKYSRCKWYHKITMDLSLKEIGVNSLRFVEMLVEIEDKFHITFPDEFISYGKISTVHDLYNVIAKLQRK